MNNFRPVALTSVAKKCLEKLVLQSINIVVLDKVDILQFAYHPNRSVDDVVALTLHSTLEHLDTKRIYGHMLFLDFGSAINMTFPMKLIVKLADLGVPVPTFNWIFLDGQTPGGEDGTKGLWLSSQVNTGTPHTLPKTSTMGTRISELDQGTMEEGGLV